MWSKAKLVIALLLPVFGIALGVVRGEQHTQNSQRYTFAVAGFDPRDLLRGHYLQYRFRDDDQPYATGCQDRDFTCCICVERPAGVGGLSVLQRMECTQARSSCDASFPAANLAGLQRYYIAEARASELTNKLQLAAARDAARVVLSISKTGEARVEAMLVDGKPIEQKLQKR